MQSRHFFLSMMTLQQTSHLQYRMCIKSTNSMGINNSTLLVKKFIPEDVFPLHNDPSRCTKHWHWRTIFKSVFFLLSNIKTSKFITSGFDICNFSNLLWFFFSKVFADVTIQTFTFFYWLIKTFGTYFKKLSLLLFPSAILRKLGVLPVIILNNTFSFTALSNGFNIIFDRFILLKVVFVLVILVSCDSLVPSTTLYESAVSKTCLTNSFHIEIVVIQSFTALDMLV